MLSESAVPNDQFQVSQSPLINPAVIDPEIRMRAIRGIGGGMFAADRRPGAPQGDDAGVVLLDDGVALGVNVQKEHQRPDRHVDEDERRRSRLVAHRHE
jgi:hypothetical protein